MNPPQMPTTQSEPKKLTPKEFNNFKQWYYREGKVFQRFGQAFWNQFSLDYHLVEVENLFYEEDNRLAEQIIFLNYVEVDDAYSSN